MRVLVICDDHWHPASTVRGGLAPLADRFDFDWIEDAGDWSAERMASYPIVVLSKSNNVSATNDAPWVDERVEAAFLDYVKAGGGLLVVHSGSAGYRGNPVLRALMGGIFETHPPQLDVTFTPQPGHPLTEGVEPFTAKDEHYFMALEADDAVVLGTTTSEHGTQPGAWIRTEGAGRVCMLTPGHNVEVWLAPGFQQLLQNALRWVAGAR